VAIALLAAVTFGASSSGADIAPENARLALLVRQLDMIERSAHESAVLTAVGERYRFDYARFDADIARIRAGIQDYLVPRRAQPRDPQILNGDYRNEQDCAP
jgi:RAQPRD family integrative conjugative element protein